MRILEPLISSKTTFFSGKCITPGDKSMSHRALILGLLAEGKTIIRGLLEGEDVLNTAKAIEKLGAKVSRTDDSWHIDGLSDPCIHDGQTLDMGNSGTAVRLLMGLVSAFPVQTKFTGDSSLTKRPMKRVITPLKLMGACFESHEARLPLTVKGHDCLKSIEYTLPVASAQVKSAILLASLGAQGTTTIVENLPTRDHTENMLRHFGINITLEKINGEKINSEKRNETAYKIQMEGKQKLTACRINIPGDPSSAAFPVVAAILIKGAAIELPNIGINERRIGLYKTLQEMGADIAFKNIRKEAGESVADIFVRYNGPLKAIDVPPDRVPAMIDEFPVLAMAASCAEGTTKMTGLGELRVKESDRLKMVAQGLRKCGVSLEEKEESLFIHGSGKPPSGGTTIETACDHRIAMAFLILGTVSENAITIDDGRFINTSFPDFIDLMNGLGASITPGITS